MTNWQEIHRKTINNYFVIRFYLPFFFFFMIDIKLIFDFEFYFFMKVQLSDFENAAYVVFIVLVTRAILTFKLNFMIPISKVSEKNAFYCLL